MRALSQIGIWFLIVAAIGWEAGQAQETTATLSPPVTVQSLGLSGTNILSLGSLSDQQLSVVVNALDATPTIPVTDLPSSGTFWSLQEPNFPPFPGDLIGVGGWQLADGSFLLDDVDYDYNSVSDSATTATGGTMTMSEEESGPPSPPGGGGGGGSTNSYNLQGTGVNYGANLFLAQIVVQGGCVSGIISNSTPGV
ncbi:MAG: hypothetical protein ABSH48_12855, partial [Verrucomicrobiota bacterium]